MTDITIQVEMDSELKEKAEDLFADLQMDMSTAINIFIHQAVRENRIPFVSSSDNSKEEVSKPWLRNKKQPAI